MPADHRVTKARHERSGLSSPRPSKRIDVNSLLDRTVEIIRTTEDRNLADLAKITAELCVAVKSLQ